VPTIFENLAVSTQQSAFSQTEGSLRPSLTPNGTYVRQTHAKKEWLGMTQAKPFGILVGGRGEGPCRARRSPQSPRSPVIGKSKNSPLIGTDNTDRKRVRQIRTEVIGTGDRQNL
jgi:hypothetical protein